MHFHLELIMPPVDDVVNQIAKILEPFSEHEESHYHPFWDWYVVGGRWAGEHLRCSVDSEKLSRFYAELERRSVTVSGVTCGKQTLQPASQIQMVDELWQSFFPESELNTCPLFSHFASNYEDNCLDADPVGQIHPNLSASRLIVAGPKFASDDLEATFMLQQEVWNGTNHQETNWDGNVLVGLEIHDTSMERYSPEYREKHTVVDDWLAVTIDYHS